MVMTTLAEQVALALGWHRGTERPAITPAPHAQTPGYWYDAHGREMASVYSDDFAGRVAFDPATQPDYVPLMLAEIERRGEWEAYVKALMTATGVRAAWSDAGVVSITARQATMLLSATPEQHAHAFVQVCGDA